MLLNNKHLFCVEDNVTNFSVMRMLLSRDGAFVHLDNWGDLTLEKLEANRINIDMILLDLKLFNGRSGYEIFAEIKKSEKFEGIPIVAVTASDADVEMPKAKEMGFDGYISKPINPETFAQQLADVFDGKAIWQ